MPGWLKLRISCHITTLFSFPSSLPGVPRPQLSLSLSPSVDNYVFAARSGHCTTLCVGSTRTPSRPCEQKTSSYGAPPTLIIHRPPAAKVCQASLNPPPHRHHIAIALLRPLHHVDTSSISPSIGFPSLPSTARALLSSGGQRLTASGRTLCDLVSQARGERGAWASERD
jgi:hypothetical protein